MSETRWTPWHVAQERINTLEVLVEAAYREGWLDGYIEVAHQEGWLNGYDDHARSQDVSFGWEHSKAKRELEK